MTKTIMIFLCKKSMESDVLVITHSKRNAKRSQKRFKEFVLGELALPCKEIKNSLFIFDNHRVIFCGAGIVSNWNDKYEGLVFYDFPKVIASQKKNRYPAPQILIDAVMNDGVTFPEAEDMIEKML